MAILAEFVRAFNPEHWGSSRPRTMAHTMNGAVANIGAHAAYDAALQLGHRAHSGAAVQITEAYTMLECELGRLTSVLLALAKEVVA